MAKIYEFFERFILAFDVIMQQAVDMIFCTTIFKAKFTPSQSMFNSISDKDIWLMCEKFFCWTHFFIARHVFLTKSVSKSF